MRRIVFSLMCGLGTAAIITGCRSEGGCPGGNCRAPSYSAPTYSPSYEDARAPESGYAPAPSYNPGPGSGARAEPAYQGSGSR